MNQQQSDEFARLKAENAHLAECLRKIAACLSPAPMQITIANDANEILQALYNSEINARIEFTWDRYIRAGIGDSVTYEDTSVLVGGYDDTRGNSWASFRTINEAIDWLANKACEKYPDSQFAKNRTIQALFRKSFAAAPANYIASTLDAVQPRTSPRDSSDESE